MKRVLLIYGMFSEYEDERKANYKQIKSHNSCLLSDANLTLTFTLYLWQQSGMFNLSLERGCTESAIICYNILIALH